MTASHGSRVRVGLIGGGDHARHALTDAIGCMPEWSIVAAADPSANARARVSATLPQARVYDNYETLLSETTGLDLVIIATPPAASARIVQSAWMNNAAILLEKPGALSPSELDGLQGGREAPVSCAYGYRFHPTVTAFRERMGHIGKLDRLELRFHAPLDVTGTWRSSRETGGGALRDLGAHLLDLAGWLQPAPLSLQHANIRSLRSEDDEASLDYNAGPVQVHIRCAYHGAPAFSLTATGPDGLLRADLWSMTTPARGALDAAMSRVRTKLPGEFRPATALRRSRMNMLSAAITHTPAHAAASIADAASVLRLIEAAEASTQ